MIVAWGLCLLLVVATIGEGGAAASSLLVQHASLCLLLVVVLVRPSGAAWRLDPAVWGCFAVFGALAFAGSTTAPYAFAAFLVILELAAFFAVVGLAARAGPALLPLLGVAIGAMAFGQSCWALVQRFANGILRPPGGFLNPNHLAAWLSAAAFLMWGVAWRRGFRARLAAGLVTLPVVAALVFIGSRGAALGLAAGVVTALACTAHTLDRRTLRRLVVAAIAVVAIGAGGVALRFRIADPLGSARLSIWKASARAVMDDPWWGTKPGQFESAAGNLNFPREGGPLRFDHGFSTPHSDVLRAPVEFGIPAALVLAAAAMFVIRGVVRRVRRSSLDTGGIGAVAAFVALAAQATVNDLTETPALYLLGAALLGFLLAVAVKAPTELRPTPAPAWRFVGALLLFAGWVAADAGPYRAWTIQAALPRGALTSPQRADLERARKLNPFQPDLAIRAVDELLAHPATWTAGTYASARETAEEAIRLSPASPEGWKALARVEGIACRDLFRDVGTRERARTAYLEAESRALHDPFLPLEAGGFLLATQDAEGARDAAFRAMRIEPNAVPARLLLAEVALAAGNETGRAEAVDRLAEAENLALRFAPVPKESLYVLRLLTTDADTVGRIRARIGPKASQRPLDARITGG